MGFFVSVILAGAIQTAALTVPPLPTSAEFAAADVPTRRAMIKRVDVRVDTAPDTTFGLIEAGLRDEDRLVRLTAANALRNLRSALTKARVDPRLTRRVDPPASFVETLSTAVDSPDAEVRLESLDALVYFDQNTERTKTRLLERYDLEDAPLLRAELLMHLRGVAPSDATVRRVVLAAIDDPAAEVRYQGVLGVAAWTPDAFLARAGQGLEEKDASMRMAWADALAAYGPRATPYLGRMRQLLAAETNARARRQLETSITSIGPTPTPAAKPF